MNKRELSGTLNNERALLEKHGDHEASAEAGKIPAADAAVTRYALLDAAHSEVRELIAEARSTR